MQRVRKAVITAAGRGTRQYPASSAVQKEMFPIVDRDGLAKPILQVIGEEAISAGVEELCIVTQPGEEAQYRQYFRRMSEDTLRAFEGKDWAIEAGEKLQEFGSRLHFVSQDRPEGFGHAVYQARSFVGDEPFLLLLGDHIYISAHELSCAGQLLDTFAEVGMAAMSAVQPTPVRLLHQFGTMKGGATAREGVYRVEAIVEKPTEEEARARLRTPNLPLNTYLCHFGMHVFPPRIFDAIEHLITHDLRRGGEIQLTDAQEHLRAALPGGDYGACTIEGRRFDTGVPYGMMESQIALALTGTHRGRIVESIARLLAEQLHSLAMR